MKTKKPNVWVVDDDDGICNAIQQLLKPKYDVDYFLSLEKLNTAFDGNTPDLLILDIMFSRDDSAGLHYLERLRESHAYLPVVICSVRNDWKAGLTAGNLGVTKFVVKDAKPRSFSKELRVQVDAALNEATLNYEIANILDDPDFFERITGRTLKSCDCVVQTSIRCFLKYIKETGPSVQRLAEMTGYCQGTSTFTKLGDVQFYDPLRLYYRLFFAFRV